MADLKPISQFATASSVEANTLLFVSTPNQNNGYDSEKVSASELGEALVNDFEYTQDLSTVSKKVTGAINENKAVIGYSYDAYDDTTAYSTGDLCIYNNTLYKAKQATTGNLPTNTTYWEQTSIADEKQDATDNSLSTTDKTIVGAINELVTYKASKSDVDNNQVSITKLNQSAFNLVATRRGHCVILAFDGSLPSGTYGNIWQCSLKPTTSIRAVVAWGTSIALIDIDTDGIIGFRNAKTITESTYIGGELVFVTPS